MLRNCSKIAASLPTAQAGSSNKFRSTTIHQYSIGRTHFCARIDLFPEYLDDPLKIFIYIDILFGLIIKGNPVINFAELPDLWV